MQGKYNRQILKGKTMRQELSILIPIYNDSCSELVTELVAQAQAIDGLSYEIIIGDDGSSDLSIVESNSKLADFDNCRFLRYEINRGRSAIRNSLADNAQYNWLLFIDGGHMRICRDNFLQKYLSADEDWQVVYGGYCLSAPSDNNYGSNLRYKFECRSKRNSDAEMRNRTSFDDFHSSNFMLHKYVASQIRFDERFTKYGYEDVIMGRDMKNSSFGVYHIDNPTIFTGYEDNKAFLQKTIESLHTLKEFENELHNYSKLIKHARLLKNTGMSILVKYLFSIRKEKWIKNLEGSNPSLLYFNLFKLGYFLSL